MTAKDTANIGTPERVPLTDLNLYHKNPRIGDTQAIKGSIVANGIFRPVVVNKGTYNDEALLDLLDWLPDLDATGYTQEDLTALEDSLNTTEEPPQEDVTNPYEDFITVRLQLPPHLAQQWLTHTTAFDSDEEALEYLLDHNGQEAGQ